MDFKEAILEIIRDMLVIGLSFAYFAHVYYLTPQDIWNPSWMAFYLFALFATSVGYCLAKALMGDDD
jgi:hypothetical protein